MLRPSHSEWSKAEHTIAVQALLGITRRAEKLARACVGSAGYVWCLVPIAMHIPVQHATHILLDLVEVPLRPTNSIW